MARDSHIRPLSEQGRLNHERIFGPPKKFRGVIRYEPESSEKVMDKDWSKIMSDSHDKRKLEKDEQKFEIPGSGKKLVLKKYWTDGQKRRAIADFSNQHNYRPGGKDVTPDSIELRNG